MSLALDPGITLGQVASDAPEVAAPHDPGDADIVTRALAGEQRCEELLYRRHARYVAAVAGHLCNRTSDAEDIVQETFVQALEHLDQLRDPGAVRVWLGRIAVRLCQRRLRKRRLLRVLGLDQGSDDATLDRLCSPMAGPEARAELAGVQRVLAAMGDDRRVPWVLHRVEGETLPAVAEMCGCSLATVKRRVAEADERLARAGYQPASEGARGAR